MRSVQRTRGGEVTQWPCFELLADRLSISLTYGAALVSIHAEPVNGSNSLPCPGSPAGLPVANDERWMNRLAPPMSALLGAYSTQRVLPTIHCWASLATYDTGPLGNEPGSVQHSLRRLATHWSLTCRQATAR